MCCDSPGCTATGMGARRQPRRGSAVALPAMARQKGEGGRRCWERIPAPLTPLPQAGDMAERASGSLTTHVLNTATGLPAAGLALRLAQLQEPGLEWTELAQR